MVVGSEIQNLCPLVCVCVCVCVSEGGGGAWGWRKAEEDGEGLEEQRKCSESLECETDWAVLSFLTFSLLTCPLLIDSEAPLLPCYSPEPSGTIFP